MDSSKDLGLILGYRRTEMTDWCIQCLWVGCLLQK